jgi:nicotinamidase/pyrazinamidase
MKTVFYDVDTQLDFLYAGGAVYVPGAERIVPAISRLNAYAASHGIPVLSTVDAHTENDPEFAQWPPHCVAGTIGQHKPSSTLLSNRVIVPNTDGLVAIAGAQQILLEKQTLDAFATRSMPRVLEELQGDRFVVYGVVTEICVQCAIRGLLARGKQVVVVGDAIRELSEEKSRATLEELRARGGAVATFAEIC